MLNVYQNEEFRKDSSHSQYLRLDPIYKNPTKFIEQEIKMLNSTYTIPKIKGRWIYINGKIPKTNENSTLRSLSDMRNIVQHQEEEKKKKFNIIRDKPISLLTKEQEDYYAQITAELLNPGPPTNPAILKPEGNIGSLLPFLMKFLINIGANDKNMEFFLNLLENKFIVPNLESNLNQILPFLLSYAGELSFSVGLKIGSITNTFSYKYPTLVDIFNRDEKELSERIYKKLEQGELVRIYSTVLKRIAFELTAGVPVVLSKEFLTRCKN